MPEIPGLRDEEPERGLGRAAEKLDKLSKEIAASIAQLGDRLDAMETALGHIMGLDTVGIPTDALKERSSQTDARMDELAASVAELKRFVERRTTDISGALQALFTPAGPAATLTHDDVMVLVDDATRGLSPRKRGRVRDRVRDLLALRPIAPTPREMAASPRQPAPEPPAARPPVPAPSPPAPPPAPAPAKPAPAKPAAAKTEAARPEAPKPEAPKPSAPSRPAPPRPARATPEPLKPEALKPVTPPRPLELRPEPEVEAKPAPRTEKRPASPARAPSSTSRATGARKRTTTRRTSKAGAKKESPEKPEPQSPGTPPQRTTEPSPFDTQRIPLRESEAKPPEPESEP